MSRESKPARNPAILIDSVAILLSIAALALGRFRMFGDGSLRFKLLSQVIAAHRLPAERYSLYGPIWAAPLWLLGDHGGPFSAALCLRSNLLHLTIGLILLFRLSWLGSLQLRLRFVLIVLACSMFPAHVQTFYGEVFTAVWSAAGIAFLLEGRWLLGTILTAVAVANTPPALVGLALVVLDRLITERRLRWLVAPMLAVALMMLENHLRRGGIFAGGYENTSGDLTILPYSGRPDFSYPILFGLLGLTLSFGKGLLYFAPGLVGGIAPIDVPAMQRDLLRLWLLFLLGLLLVYAKWWAWYGGWFWGPRFLLFASFPASLILARLTTNQQSLSVPWRWMTAAMMALSVWVGVSAYFVDLSEQAYMTVDNYAFEFLHWYVPEFSVLWFPLISWPDLAPLADHPVYASMSSFNGLMHGFGSSRLLGAGVFTIVAAVVLLPTLCSATIGTCQLLSRKLMIKTRWRW